MTKRRLIILRAAERLLFHYGPSKTTVADIAREARIGVGTVYLEFTSKDSILEALSEAQHTAVLEAERRAWAEGGSARERLRRVLDARFEAFGELARAKAHAQDLFLCESPPIERAHERFERAEEELLTEMIARAMEAGQWPNGEPRDVARALIRTYAAFAPPLLFREPRDQLRKDLEAVHALVLGQPAAG